MLINTVVKYQKSHYISIVATCAGINKIGPELRPAKGMLFFRTVLQIPNLEKVYLFNLNLFYKVNIQF